MQIATITCHDVYNYGASLQAYALQEYCYGLRLDYRIIDYKPPYLSSHYRFDVVANSRYDRPLIKQIYLLAKLPGRLIALKRKRRFDSFTRKYLKLTNQRFLSNEELSENCPKANIYIAGSDQIWNTIFPNGHDAAFYLDFVGCNGRKISYAASFATERIHNEAEEFVKTMLDNFDAISVRESSALNLLKDLGQKDSTLVCDPVFLLNSEDWRKLINNVSVPSNDYILVYDCERSVKVQEIAKELRQQTSLPIYRVSATYGSYSSKDFSKSGPLEFLALLANARFVVANSFHALAFSLIFKKDFFIVNRTEGINTRMRDFLSYIGLLHRLIDSKTQVCSQAIDFDLVTPRINKLIYDSKTYLDKQFSYVESKL